MYSLLVSHIVHVICLLFDQQNPLVISFILKDNNPLISTLHLTQFFKIKIRFITEKNTEKTLKQALVETVQIVSVTGLNSKRKSLFSRSKTCSKSIKVEAKQLNNPNVAPVAAILISSCEKPAVNKLTTDNKSSSPHHILTPSGIAADETSCGLFERSSIDHQMLEIQKLSNNPRSYCCNSSKPL